MRDGVITEADTCREFVTPRLVEAGWDAAPHAIGELNFAAKRAAAVEAATPHWQRVEAERNAAMRSHEAEVMRLLGEIEALVAEVQA